MKKFVLLSLCVICSTLTIMLSSCGESYHGNDTEPTSDTVATPSLNAETTTATTTEINPESQLTERTEITTENSSVPGFTETTPSSDFDFPEGTVYVETLGANIPVYYEEDAVNDSFLNKYYVSSKENEDDELWEDFERKLAALPMFDFGDSGNQIILDELKIARASYKEKLINECTIKAAEQNIGIEEYLRNNYLLMPGFSAVGYDSDTYMQFFVPQIVKMDCTAVFLAECWNISADESEIANNVNAGMDAEKAYLEATKKAVFEYSVANSEIVYEEPDVDNYIEKKEILDSKSVNDSLLHEMYVNGEDGYAAVYKAWFVTQDDDLEQFMGEKLYGNLSFYRVHRIYGYDGWEYLLEYNSDYYMMVKFDRWITPYSEDYETYKQIYGTEPVIKQ